MKRKQKNAIFPILLFLIALALLLPCLAGCGTANKGPADGTSSNDSNPASSEEATEPPYNYEENIPVRDYDNADFTILVSNQMQNYYIPSEKVMDVVSDAVYTRNSKVAETFKINLVYKTMNGNIKGAEEFATAIRTSCAANMPVYDIVTPQAYYGVGLAFENAYYNLNHSDFLHWDENWWFSRINREATVSNRLYFAAGSFLMDKLDSLMCVFFNADIYRNLGFSEDLYELVNDGKWTLSTMKTYSVAYWNQFGSLDVTDGAGYYGHVSDTHAIRALLVGGNVPVVERDETDDEAITITYYGDRLINVFEGVFDFINGGSAWWTTDYDTPTKIFSEGRALFYTHNVGRMLSQPMRDMSNEYGILPIPKYDEEQEEYYSSAMRWEMMSVMRNCDTERACIIMENLCYNTNKILIPEYWEKTMQYKYSRSVQVKEMLEKIRMTLYFQFTDIFNTQLDSIGERPATLIRAKSATLSSWWADNVDSFKMLVKQLVRNYQKVPDTPA